MTAADPLTPGIAEVNLALAGLAHELEVLGRDHLSGPGIKARRDEVRANIDRLLDVRLTYAFIELMTRAWWVLEGETRPAWPQGSTARASPP